MSDEAFITSLELAVIGRHDKQVAGLTVIRTWHQLSG